MPWTLAQPTPSKKIGDWPDFPADVLVYRDGEKAVAVTNKGEKIAESTDHASVVQSAVDYVGDGILILQANEEFIFTKSVELKDNMIKIQGWRTVIKNPGVIAFNINPSSSPTGYDYRLIEGFIFEGDGSGGTIGIKINCANGVNIRDCMFKKQEYGILFSNSDKFGDAGKNVSENWYLQHLKFWDCLYGIYMKYNANAYSYSFGKAEHLYFGWNAGVAVGVGIYLDSNIYITDTIWEQIKFWDNVGSKGIYYDALGNPIFRRIRFEHHTTDVTCIMLDVGENAGYFILEAPYANASIGNVIMVNNPHNIEFVWIDVDFIDIRGSSTATSLRLRRYDRTGAFKIYTTQPPNPEPGTMYFDPSTGELKIYDGSVWKTVALT